MNSTNFILGADIGGSHITAGIVNMCTMSVDKPSVVRNKLNSQGTADEILEAWSATLQGFIESKGIEKIGFAMPGPFDYENGISRITGLSKYESLYGLDIRAYLSEKLKLKPEHLLFRNDAEAFLAGELSGGAATGYMHAIGITLGTGMGSAVSHNGETVNVEKGSMPYKGEIMEEFVSSRGLLREYYRLTGEKVSSVLELSSMYHTREAVRKAFDNFEEHLIWFLQYFIETEKPDVLVIGGNISKAWDLFMPSVIAKLGHRLSAMPVVAPAVLDEDAALVGAACCFDPARTLKPIA